MTRPACSVCFHVLNTLIKSKPVQGTVTEATRPRSARARRWSRRHSLNANRAAPACGQAMPLVDCGVEAVAEARVAGEHLTFGSLPTRRARHVDGAPLAMDAASAWRSWR
jgi:hypothetical protein